MITVSVLSDRLRINASLARIAIKELVEEGQIRKVFEHNKQQVYTRATK
jgi:small subunit ribosomal protein S25e